MSSLPSLPIITLQSLTTTKTNPSRARAVYTISICYIYSLYVICYMLLYRIYVMCICYMYSSLLCIAHYYVHVPCICYMYMYMVQQHGNSHRIHLVSERVRDHACMCMCVCMRVRVRRRYREIPHHPQDGIAPFVSNHRCVYTGRRLLRMMYASTSKRRYTYSTMYLQKMR